MLARVVQQREDEGWTQGTWICNALLHQNSCSLWSTQGKFGMNFLPKMT